eukprot:TRINITY_DN2424_c0_g1_i1.p1 TRINITY_DN2424_c0_g1~~TRINITY_DN2424_c0_g1_i1.p1  ORF type:complete len:479 (-),score=32.37 TRINITY_DN2424_c0_g1_i1:62-1498(-)
MKMVPLIKSHLVILFAILLNFVAGGSYDAVCNLRGPNIFGHINFEVVGDGGEELRFDMAPISGLPNGSHAIHINMFGDLSDWETGTGDHYHNPDVPEEPENCTKMGPATPDELFWGIIGTFKVYKNKMKQIEWKFNSEEYDFTDLLKRENSIIGRSVVIHQNGGCKNSGPKLAQCVIGKHYQDSKSEYKGPIKVATCSLDPELVFDQPPANAVSGVLGIEERGTGFNINSESFSNQEFSLVLFEHGDLDDVEEGEKEILGGDAKFTGSVDNFTVTNLPFHSLIGRMIGVVDATDTNELLGACVVGLASEVYDSHHTPNPPVNGVPPDPTDTKPTEPTDTKPADPTDKPTEPTDTKPTTPTDTTPTDTKPTSPTDTKPTEPTDTTPTSPTDTKPTEPTKTTPTETDGETKGSEPPSDDADDKTDADVSDDHSSTPTTYSKNGLIVGIILACIVLIGVIYFAVRKNQPQDKGFKRVYGEF